MRSKRSSNAVALAQELETFSAASTTARIRGGIDRAESSSELPSRRSTPLKGHP
jgi:hypothetical protein